MVAGRFAEACPKLEESQRLEPKGGTQLNVAACHERLGKIATAWVEFHDAVVTARTEGHPERERLAQQRVDALEPRLPWLTVSIAPGAGGRDLTIQIDGATIQPFALGKDMPIDPGEHRITAVAAGVVVADATLLFKEGTRQSILIPALAATARAAPSDKAPPEAPAAEELPAEAPELPSPRPSKHPRPRLAPPGCASSSELGAFAGFLGGDMDRAELDGSEDQVSVSRQTSMGVETATCGSVECTYRMYSQGGFVTGPSVFAGVAWNDRFQLGLRALGEPRAGGGGLFAIGPSLSAHVWGPLWAGGSLLFGAAGSRGRPGDARVPDYYVDQNVRPRMSGSLGFALGASAEISLEVMKRPKSSLLIQTTPLFLLGSNGFAGCVPFGLAYRWR